MNKELAIRLAAVEYAAEQGSNDDHIAALYDALEAALQVIESQPLPASAMPSPVDATMSQMAVFVTAMTKEVA